MFEISLNSRIANSKSSHEEFLAHSDSSLRVDDEIELKAASLVALVSNTLPFIYSAVSKPPSEEVCFLNFLQPPVRLEHGLLML